MKRFEYTINDELGIHARPAGILIKEAGLYSSEIYIEKGDKKADMTKLFSVLGLGVKFGDTIIVYAKGEDEEAAIQAIRGIFEKNL